jgi:tRNA (cmo5U34)-methyltransferase
LLDVGCGAGNYTLKLLERVSDLEVTLVDLSQPMLDRACQRVSPKTSRPVHTIQADVRDLELPVERYDIVTAAAVLHHLRTDEEWTSVFRKLYACVRPGGSLWIADLVEHSTTTIQSIMWQRYGQYLEALGGADDRDRVFAYIEREDTPRPLCFQLDLLRTVGFQATEVLHKNSVFAAFGAIK